ncbi:MAG: hypothetical protein MJ252_30230 [archaeon]|nr:hypothetical protein [archaeon]
MNIEQGLEDHMSFISPFCGVTLSIEERLKLDNELSKMKAEIQCDEILFWGKIMGAEKDYYIAKALYYKDSPFFPKKKFFFCTNSKFVFSELPPIQNHHLPDFNMFNSYFIGNPDTILVKYDKGKENKGILQEEEEMIEKGIYNPNLKLKNLTEGDRLSFVVRTIDEDTSVVPIGGFKMLPIGELRRNDIFDGLSCEDLGKMEKYFHFRKTRNSEKKNLIDMGDAVFDFSFMDCLNEDEVKGAWSIKLSSDKTVSHIRSMLWPGYYAYHKANTDLFGGIYIGYGIKNKDFAFMQQ